MGSENYKLAFVDENNHLRNVKVEILMLSTECCKSSSTSKCIGVCKSTQIFDDTKVNEEESFIK